MSKKPAPRAVKGAAGAAAKAPVITDLLGDIQQLIQNARRAAATAVNISLTMLYWRIGRRIREDVLVSKRAGYGEEIVATLSRQLAAGHGRGFEVKNLHRMVQFAEVYPAEEIVVSLMRHLSWTHFLVLLPVKDPLARDFYAQMCQIEGWSVRALRDRVASMLFERTALSKNPDELIRHELDALRAQGDLSPTLLLKDPCERQTQVPAGFDWPALRAWVGEPLVARRLAEPTMTALAAFK